MVSMSYLARVDLLTGEGVVVGPHGGDCGACPVQSLVVVRCLRRLAAVNFADVRTLQSKCGRCAKSAGSGGSFRAGASHFEISPASPPRADLTTTATTDDYDTTFGTIQIFPFKEQRRILETDGGSIGPYKTGKMGDASVTASSWRLVERGRVVLFKKGQYAGKLAAIAQIIDHRRVRSNETATGPSGKPALAY